MILFIIFFSLFIISFVFLRIIHNRKNFNNDSLKFTIMKFIILFVSFSMLVLSIITGIKWFFEVL